MSTELFEGYVWLSSYDDRHNRNQEHSTDYKRVFDAIKEGRVHGVQDGKSKRWMVNKAQADAFLSEWAESARTPRKSQMKSAASYSQVEAAVIALCEMNNGITLMQCTLERLAVAVEAIANQPKTAHDRLVATVESNGFHN